MTKTAASIGSHVAGVVFGASWWILADAGAYTKAMGQKPSMEFLYLIPALVGVVGNILVNIIPWNLIQNDGLDDGNKRGCACFLLANVMLWGSVGGAIGVYIVNFTTDELAAEDHELNGYNRVSRRVGIAVIIQACFNLLSALILRLTRRDSMASI